MEKLKLEIELQYNPEIIYGSKSKIKDMLINDILTGDLNLFSDEIGDEINQIKITNIVRI